MDKNRHIREKNGDKDINITEQLYMYCTVLYSIFRVVQYRIQRGTTDVQKRTA